MPSESPTKRPRPYMKTGVYALRTAVRKLGTLPTKRTALGRELHAWRDALVADLGGADAVSTQQLALVDLAVRTKLLADSIDAYVLGMPSPVNKQRRCLHPVVKERQALVGQLQSILRDLGLDRRAKEVPTLDAYLAEKAKEREATMPAATEKYGGNSVQ